MRAYHIIGTVGYTEYCDCCYCDGHTRDWRVDTTVAAKNPRDAAVELAEQMMKSPPYTEELIPIDEITANCTISEAAEDITMRLLNQPELFPGVV